MTSISLIANLVAAGFLTTIGLLIGPLSNELDIDLTNATKLFSWLTGSYFIATIVTFIALDYLSIRAMLLLYTAGILLASLGTLAVDSAAYLTVILCVIGFFCGTSICVAGTIIGIIWKQKQQQIILLSQDAIFNIGGIIFPFLTVFILGAGLHWGISYVVAALPLLIVIYLIAISSWNIEFGVEPEAQQTTKTEWNASVILAGIFLFSIIAAKYVYIIWLPNYAETQLGATATQSGELIARMFGVALFGSIIGAILIAKTNLTLFVASAVFIGLLGSLQITGTSDVGELVLAVSLLGLSLSVLYNGFMAYGIAQLSRPSHKHVSYIIFCGSAGAMVAPMASGLLVESFGLTSTLNSVPAIYGFVFIVIAARGISLHFLTKPKRN